MKVKDKFPTQYKIQFSFAKKKLKLSSNLKDKKGKKKKTSIKVE